MSTQELTYIFVGLSFALYILIAIASRVKSTKDFYVAGSGVNPVVNGMATAADWMSAASFLSMAGIIAFLGRDGSVYLMGWTGGYVLLALLLAPYLRKFGKYTVPDFIGTRYYSRVARVVAVVCLIFVSFTYVAGQMRGVGIVFSRFLEVDINTGVIVGMAIVFIYAVLGGMKGITYTQVAQYCVLIFAYLVPAIFISIMITGNPIPQLGLGTASAEGTSVLTKLDNILQDLGFSPYTSGVKSSIDVFAITAALMFGTAGLPHVLVRFFTVPKVSDARKSAGYALVFIAILYTTAPAVASFARLNIIDTLHDVPYSETPKWVNNWENTGLIAWLDKNDDGIIQYGPGSAFSPPKPIFTDKQGDHGQRLIENKPSKTSNNEIYIDRDIIVLANPEIAGLPAWVIALVAAKISDRQELLYARISSAIAICVAGLFGIYPPAFVAQVVAFAFGLAASSLFPALLMGIFSEKITKEGAIAGMLTGLIFTFSYIVYFKFVFPEHNSHDYWLFGISPEGIGLIGMILNFFVAKVVSNFSKKPPESVIALIKSLRNP